MSDVSRSCARCHGVAVVARGNAAYCLSCNDIMDWSEVIAIVQGATEPSTIPTPASSPAPPSSPSVTPDIRDDPGQRRSSVAPALVVPAGETVEPDPFSQRLV